MTEHYLGVDLGGTKILTAVSDEKGNIITSSRVSTEADRGQNQVINNIMSSINSVLSQTDLTLTDIKRIGVGSPGPLNISEGIVVESPNLGWENVPLVDILKEKTGIAVVLENDANAAALGEKWFGIGKDVDNLIYITVSTGIGGGIIINRRILHGANDTAGEIGHFVVHTDGPICGCGNHGCFEAVASGTAINSLGRELAIKYPDSLLYKMVKGDPEKIDGRIVAEAARHGDKMAEQIWHDEARYLGIGIANLLNIFNTEMIILGGGVMNAWDLINDVMKETIEEYTFNSAYESAKICRAALGDEVGVKGAIAVAMGDRLIS